MIESKTETRGATGEVVETWSTLATLHAGKRDTKGDERFKAQQIEDRVETVFRIRHRTDLDQTMRILYGGDYYEIRGITELGRRDGLELMAARQISAT